jgi:hypothetical protein
MGIPNRYRLLLRASAVVALAVGLKLLVHLTPLLAALEQWTQATLVARLKQEQSNLRRTLTRIHTIRETSFVSSGYLLADLVTILLCTGLILAKIEPFYESLFFAGIISYLMVYLLMLIRDLDNPFGYYERDSAADVSLKPLEDAARRLAQLATTAASPQPIETKSRELTAE